MFGCAREAMWRRWFTSYIIVLPNSNFSC